MLRKSFIIMNEQPQLLQNENPKEMFSLNGRPLRLRQSFLSWVSPEVSPWGQLSCCSLPSLPWVGTETVVAAAGKSWMSSAPCLPNLRGDTGLHLQGFGSQPLLNRCSNTNRGKRGFPNGELHLNFTAVGSGAHSVKQESCTWRCCVGFSSAH